LGPGADVLRLTLGHWKGEVRVKSAECYNGEHTNIVKRQINRKAVCRPKTALAYGCFAPSQTVYLLIPSSLGPWILPMHTAPCQ
jgi:hypothetical protein